MRWLLTLRRDVDRQDLDARLADWGCRPSDDAEPIPLGEDEQVLAVEGPDDLPDRTRDEELVREVFPDSEMSYFDPGGSGRPPG
ncbi:MAG: hypothetical protein D6696_02140 [Acidobacteria bacterium]|nr:MAG: hypothetical protein D6696_02140 [Acidobacteriota bacterium]